MKLNLLMFLVLSLGLAPAALGRDKKIRRVSTGESRETSQLGASRSAMGTSEIERQSKRFSVNLELIGLATPMAMGSGLRAGYFLKPNWVFELGVASATAKGSDDDSLYSSSDTYSFSGYDAERIGTSTITEVHVKHFVNNSFYWSVGPAHRQTKAELRAYEDSFFEEDEERTTIATLDAADVGLSGTIGNQWQWSNFTLGCDWVGLYQPVITLKDDLEDGETPEDSKGIDGTRKTFKDDLTTMNAQGVRFYMGASF